MKYYIDSNSKQSMYMQLYKQLREDIVNSVYKYGNKLPSKRLLASETLTSVITVEHAYSILCDEGYVESRERSGYYVTYRKKDFMPVGEVQESFNAAEQGYIHTDDEFPFSVFAKTMRNVISKYSDKILIKSPNSGCYELRKAIRDYLMRGKGIKVDTDQIIIGAGAEYLYGLIVQLLGREKTYAIENPSYEKIHAVYEANNVRCELLKLEKDGIATKELLKTKATVLHVTPFRSFPSNITASASKRWEYIAWACERNGIIIEDDYESEYTVLKKSEDTLFSLKPDGRVIYLNTFTKTIAPSMRVGYMVLPKDLVKVFADKLGFYSCPVPMFEQYVIAELINNGDFERHINKVRRKRRQMLKQLVDKSNRI
ncbi:MAG: PLP-dependent aminotransferase family protein [Clostridia bacterium]|nr:PLP-dependent aminotransferase family protein [Clostridia bacterium]